jgi:RNA polymerase sigma-70 factor (ECF subfamily)
MLNVCAVHRTPPIPSPGREGSLARASESAVSAPPVHLRVVRHDDEQPGAGAQAQVPMPAPPVDPSDFEALYRRYAPYVAAIAARILGRDQDLDDLVQDAFVNALRGLQGLRDQQAIKGWLAKITVRLATRRLRQLRLKRALHLSRDAQDEPALYAPGATEEQRALIARVYRVLDALPAADRVAWVLRYVEGEPLLRLPELCDCSLSTAQRRLSRAQQAIERELGHE